MAIDRSSLTDPRQAVNLVFKKEILLMYIRKIMYFM